MDKCVLCSSAVDNELCLGKFYIKDNIVVHQNCLYLSSNLVQRGNGQNDILNFTLCDIAAESKRIKNLICCYCQRSGANIGCCNSGCRKAFHTICGINHGSQNQFVGTYKSFCKNHVKKYTKRPQNEQKCVICFELLMKSWKKFCCTKYMYGMCCKNGWYHKDCLQHYANSSGYFFKCPLCNDTAKFRLVSLWGITVPNRDASWEENDAYADQLILSNRCTAEECLDSGGREAITSQALLYCILCGSNPMHVVCTKYTLQDYHCNDCNVFRTKPQSYESDSDDIDPIERLTMLQTVSNQGTSRQMNQMCDTDKKHTTLISISNSNSDSDSDFDFWDDLSLMYKAAEKENSATEKITAQPTPVYKPRQPRTKPLRTHNSQALSLVGGSGDGVSRRSLRNLAKIEDPHISQIRTRSRSQLSVFESLQPEVGNNWEEEPLSRRVRQSSPESIKARSPLISRGRLPTRSNVADQQIQQIHPPLDISCVANRTRARSSK